MCTLLQNGATPRDLAQKAGHMTIARLMSGPDTYQQNLDAGLGGQVGAALHSLHLNQLLPDISPAQRCNTVLLKVLTQQLAETEGQAMHTVQTCTCSMALQASHSQIQYVMKSTLLE